MVFDTNGKSILILIYILIYKQCFNSLNNIIQLNPQLQWYFPCHKYLGVTNVKTRKDRVNIKWKSYILKGS